MGYVIMLLIALYALMVAFGAWCMLKASERLEDEERRAEELLEQLRVLRKERDGHGKAD